MRPIFLIRSVAATAAITLAVAGCGSSNPSTPTPAAATNAVQGATASTAPTDTPTPAAPSAAAPSAAGPSIALPSIALPSLNSDASLESHLPDTLNGVKLQKISQKGFGNTGDPTTNQELTKALGALGKTPNDVSFAFAFDPTGQVTTGIVAYTISGVDAAQFDQLFFAALKASDPAETSTSTTLGGKSVTKVTTSKQTLFVYPSGQILYLVTGDDPAGAAAALDAVH